MNELKLQHLLARHMTADMDKLEFTRRIASEHLFTSIDECFEYLTKMITFVSVNPDDPKGPNMNTLNDAPILAINVIDEAVCSLIYEIDQQIYRKDNDFLGYISNKVTELSNILLNTKYPEKYASVKSSLYAMLMLISFHTMPIPNKEEVLYSQVSYGYYQLMRDLYKAVTPKDDYIRTYTAYYELKCK